MDWERAFSFFQAGRDAGRISDMERQEKNELMFFGIPTAFGRIVGGWNLCRPIGQRKRLLGGQWLLMGGGNQTSVAFPWAKNDEKVATMASNPLGTHFFGTACATCHSGFGKTGMRRKRT